MISRYRLEQTNSLLPSVTITGSKLEVGSPSAKAVLHPLTGFTSASPSHTSTHTKTGWTAGIELDHQGRTMLGEQSKWRSGEALKGVVRLNRTSAGTGTGGEGGVEPSSVICRAFTQSTTLYWVMTLAQDYSINGRLGKLKPNLTPLRTDADLRVEWNRSYVGGQGAELWRGGELDEIVRQVDHDFAVLGNRHQPTADTANAVNVEDGDRLPLDEYDTSAPSSRDEFVLPFEFTLPTTMRVSEANQLANAPQARAFSHAFRRCPPPSLPATEGKDGCIEWTVEVLVRFPDPSEPPAGTEDDTSAPLEPIPSPSSGSEELPSFNQLSTASAECMSAFGLMSSSDSVLVHRVVFPFEPSDLHAQDFYSSWRPNVNTAWAAAVANYNGIAIDEIEDLSPIEGEVVPSFGRDARDEALGGSNMGPLRQMKGSLVDVHGGRSMWSSYEKRMPVKNKISRLVGWNRTETSLPKPAMITRHASTLDILLYISYDVLPNRDSSKLRPVFFDHVLVTLSKRTLTRGGREDRPHFLIEELRRQEINLSQDGHSRLRLNPGEGRDINLAFDLQSEGFVSVNGALKQLYPVKDVGLSFRTPNVEVEFIIAATITPQGGNPFYLLRCPIQLLSGTLDAVPAFDDHQHPAAREAAVPAAVTTVEIPLASPASGLSGAGGSVEHPPDYAFVMQPAE